MALWKLNSSRLKSTQVTQVQKSTSNSSHVNEGVNVDAELDVDLVQIGDLVQKMYVPTWPIEPIRFKLITMGISCEII